MKESGLNSDKFILYNTADGKASVKLYAENDTVWLSLDQMAELFQRDKSTISRHIGNILDEGELEKDSVVAFYATTAADGKKYNVAYFSLDMILAVGFRVRSIRGTQFRKWANTALKEFLKKGYLLDKERLKNPDGRPDYYDDLLDEIRDIRASEKRFYQKIRDLFALSSDYDPKSREVQLFFAETQNKLIYGVTGMTAAELIYARADSHKPNMALTSWQGRIVRKRDVYVSKNYLTKNEIDILNRLVSAFLENAELRVKLRRDLTIQYWKSTVDKLLQDNDIDVLQGSGKISNAEMEARVDVEYEKYEERRRQRDVRLADEQDFLELEAEIKELK